MRFLEMHRELCTQHERIADGAAAAWPDDILHIRREREPAFEGDLVIRLHHCFSGRVWKSAAEDAGNAPYGRDVVGAAGHEALIAHASPQERGQGVDARLRGYG